MRIRHPPSNDSWLKEHCPTPNIDSLARDGMLFEHCYVTNSICGPMRAAIQTGKYSHANGFLVNGNKFDGTQQTFPKLLRKAGYTTAVVGKWHLGTHMSLRDTITLKYSLGKAHTTTHLCVSTRMGTESTTRSSSMSDIRLISSPTSPLIG